MIHDPCIVPQLKSKKKERDDWFLVRMGCFNGDPDGEGSGKGGASDLDDTGEAIASDFVDPYDQDEAADFRDSLDESTGESEPGERSADIGDNQTRAVNIANIAGIPDIDFDEESDRDESPLSFFEDVTAKQARERREKERGIRQDIRQEEFSNMVKGLPGVDPDEPEGGATPRPGTFRSDIFGDPDPLDFFSPGPEFDPPGGAAQLTSIPGVGTAGSPLQQQIREARGPSLGGSAGDFEGVTFSQGKPAFDASAQGLRPTFFNEGVTPEDLEEEAKQALKPDVPFSIRTMRGPTFSPDPEEFQQFDETDYLDLGKIGPEPPKGEEDNRASDSLVERRKRGIAAARAAAAKNPLAQSPDLTGIRVGDVNIPLGPAGMLAQGIGAVGTEIYNTFANPTAKTIDNIQNKGHGAVYGVEGNLIGSVDPETGAVQATEGNAFNPELEPYYAEARRRQEEDREARGGTGNQAPVAAVQPTMTAAPAPVPQASPMTVPAYQYQPRSPVQYSYTGIPTLAPVMLKPTFTAPERFSPLFNLGRTRRS